MDQDNKCTLFVSSVGVLYLIGAIVGDMTVSALSMQALLFVVSSLFKGTSSHEQKDAKQARFKNEAPIRDGHLVSSLGSC